MGALCGALNLSNFNLIRNKSLLFNKTKVITLRSTVIDLNLKMFICQYFKNYSHEVKHERCLFIFIKGNQTNLKISFFILSSSMYFCLISSLKIKHSIEVFLGFVHPFCYVRSRVIVSADLNSRTRISTTDEVR